MVASNNDATLLHLLEEVKAENAQIRARMVELESDYHRFAIRSATAEERLADLAALYVTALQLHRTLDRTLVIGAIREVLTGLLGCEHFALFERTSELTFRLIASDGIDAYAFRELNAVVHPLGHLLASGKRWVTGDSESGVEYDEEIVAAIPLIAEEQVVGGIVLFRLLPQKQSLSAIDYDLFDLLQTHAATALCSTNLYELSSGERCS